MLAVPLKEVAVPVAAPESAIVRAVVNFAALETALALSWLGGTENDA